MCVHTPSMIHVHVLTNKGIVHNQIVASSESYQNVSSSEVSMEDLNFIKRAVLNL